MNREIENQPILLIYVLFPSSSHIYLSHLTNRISLFVAMAPHPKLRSSRQIHNPNDGRHHKVQQGGLDDGTGISLFTTCKLHQELPLTRFSPSSGNRRYKSFVSEGPRLDLAASEIRNPFFIATAFPAGGIITSGPVSVFLCAGKCYRIRKTQRGIKSGYGG